MGTMFKLWLTRCCRNVNFMHLLACFQIFSLYICLIPTFCYVCSKKLMCADFSCDFATFGILECWKSAFELSVCLLEEIWEDYQSSCVCNKSKSTLMQELKISYGGKLYQSGRHTVKFSKCRWVSLRSVCVYRPQERVTFCLEMTAAEWGNRLQLLWCSCDSWGETTLHWLWRWRVLNKRFNNTMSCSKTAMSAGRPANVTHTHTHTTMGLLCHKEGRRTG